MPDGRAPRLLVLDNNEELELHLIPEFRSLGYDVRFVNTAEATSIQELHRLVRAAARNFRPHVAVVDLRLYDDDIDEDLGIQMLPYVSSAACILYSSYATKDIMRQGFKAGFLDCIEKQHSPEDLISSVETASQRGSSAANKCSIRWPKKWEKDSVFDTLFGDTCDYSISMVNDLIFQLFPRTRRFDAGRIDRAIGALPEGAGKRSLAIRVQPEGMEPMVVKLANASKIRRERIRYRKFIEGKIPGALHTRIVSGIEFWDIGGIAYSLVGMPDNTLTSFSSFYSKTADTSDILKPLKYLFSEVWIRHYDAAAPRGKQTSLYDIYDKSLKLTRRIERLLTARPKLSDSLVAMIIEDPVTWLIENAEESFSQDAKVAITHGDLHGNNIFVDVETARVWVIDFERTGCGHCLRDFTELTADILTHLLPGGTVSDFEFSRLCVDLLALESANRPAKASQLTSGNAATAKAYEVTQGLHEIAKSITHFHDWQEYVWSLLFDAIFIASWSRAEPLQQSRAYVLSALLCERLKAGEGVWPTQEVTAALNAASETAS